MSLVNDMLKDLEANRRDAVPAGVFPQGQNESQVRPRWPVLLAGALALSAVGAAFYLGQRFQHSEAPRQAMVQVQAQSHASLPADPAGLNSSPATEPFPASAPANPAIETDTEKAMEVVAETSALPVQSNSDNPRIAQLLAEAEQAMGDDRLTSPINDNAFTRFQAVLLIEPDRSEALAGIRGIAERYLDFYQRKARTGESRAADIYRDRAEQVVRQYPDLQHWLQGRIAAIEPTLRPATGQAGQTAEAKPAITGGSTSPAPRAPVQASVRLQAGAAELDQADARRARELLAKGRNAEAIALLTERLAASAPAPASTRQLMEVYLSTNNSSAARSLLSQTSLPQHEQLHFAARLSVQDGDIAAAVSQLESASPALDQTPDYYAYLAALYHKLARYEDAAGLYRGLLARNQQQATYWLGLAVSLDAIKDYQGALAAFQRVRLYSTPDSPSRAYVEERIRHLSG